MIKSKPATKASREGWERTFRKKEPVHRKNDDSCPCTRCARKLLAKQLRSVFR
jgi:hypothetical protein